MVIKHIVADEIKFNAMQQSCNLKAFSLVYKNIPLAVIENLMVFDIGLKVYALHRVLPNEHVVFADRNIFFNHTSHL